MQFILINFYVCDYTHTYIHIHVDTAPVGIVHIEYNIIGIPCTASGKLILCSFEWCFFELCNIKL